MSKYHMLNTFIKHTKCNFITPPIYNKIMIGAKITVYIYYNTLF